MASGSFFIQRPEDALRHLSTLTKGLKKIAIAGWLGGVACTAMAALLTHYLTPPVQANGAPGVREISGIVVVAWFMAIALLLFSTLYFISGWGLSHQKIWGRYAASGTFLSKVALCAWLGRGSGGALITFLLIAAWDFYGLWVLLSKETGQLFTAPARQFAAIKPTSRQTAS